MVETNDDLKQKIIAYLDDKKNVDKRSYKLLDETLFEESHDWDVYVCDKTLEIRRKFQKCNPNGIFLKMEDVEIDKNKYACIFLSFLYKNEKINPIFYYIYYIRKNNSNFYENVINTSTKNKENETENLLKNILTEDISIVSELNKKWSLDIILNSLN